MASFTDPSEVVKVIEDGTVELLGNGGTDYYTVDYEDGDTGFDIGPGNEDETVVIYARNRIRGSRRGKQNPLEVSFTVGFRTFTNSKSGATNPASLRDVITGTGGASGWTKASSAHQQWNLDLRFTVAGSTHGDGANHVATFSSCIFKYGFKEGDPSKVTITAQVLGGVTVTGPA